MLDLKTILVLACAIASLQAVTWGFVWRAWRRLYELKFLAAAFAAIAAGLLLMILRGATPPGWLIVLDNTVIKLGLVLLAEGLARFLGQPRYSWIGITLLLLQIVMWSIAVALDPADIATRIHASTLFTIIMMAIMCLALARDRTQPTLLRWITIAILAEYMAASVLQSAIEWQLPANLVTTTVLADRNAWYFLQGTLFLIALFACLLFMVSARLSADLRANNRALSREVQARRRLESRLNTSLETERALREEQLDFMRIVSHEFRTPLAIIRNATDMIDLTGDQSPQTNQERIAGIGEALDRLFLLIDRFMGHDQDAGYQPELMRAAALLADVQLHFDMTGRGARLRFEDPEPNVMLHGDPDMLGTVLINLIDNALKYSPAEQTVIIDALEQDAILQLRVRDQGIGIPAAELHRVGQRFFRASNTQSGTGTGLGLYATRKLLNYHGGSLQLQANAGGGTLAIVSLPIAQNATEHAATQQPDTAQPSAEQVTP